MSDLSSRQPEGTKANKVKSSRLAAFFRSEQDRAWIKALKISSIYFLIGSLWIIMSDKIAAYLFTDPDDLVTVNIAKGWLYVLTTAVILYMLIHKELRRVVASKTEVTKMNRELEKSNTLFSAILESSPEIMVYSVDRNYCYTAFNNRHKYSMLRKWNRETFNGMNALDLISDPEQKKNQKANYDRALAGEYFSFIDEYGTDVEALTYWQNHYSPIMNQEHEIIGLTCFILNITALKRAQEKNQYLSYHDNLTGVYNRRYYEEVLARIDKERHMPISIIIGDLNGLKLVNDAFGHATGDRMLKGAAEALSSACRPQDIIARWGGDEFIVLLPSTGPDEVEEIVETAKRVCAQTVISTIPVDVSFGWYTKVSVDESMSSALKNAEDYMYKNKIIESKSMRSDTIKAIMKTLHEKNPREEAHSKRVGELSRKIGKALHFSETEINTLNLVGFLHDIGKIAIEEGILNKPGILNEGEFEMIRQHPEIGCRIIRSAYEVSEIAEAILYHHERWDGSGYPEGIRGETIPKFARIIAIADSFDAMTSERTYKSIMTTEEAAKEILANAGRQYDPVIARVFVEDVLGIKE